MVAALWGLLSSSGCSGGNCPFTRPSCCDNALFGCGPFDLPQGCSCADYFSRSFSGAPLSLTATARPSSRAAKDSTWRISLEKRTGDCSYISDRVRTTLLMRTQGRQLFVRALGYPRLRGTRSGRTIHIMGQHRLGLPACTISTSAAITLSRTTQGQIKGSVAVSCQNTLLSCSAEFTGEARRISTP